MVQTVPQAPQLSVFEFTSTQTPPQVDCPAGHPHAPLEQA
jgi:hypothetical protein